MVKKNIVRSGYNLWLGILLLSLPNCIVKYHRPDNAHGLFAVNRTELEAVARVTLQFRLGTELYFFTFRAIRECGPPIILGLDFFEKHKVRLEYGQKMLAIGDNIIRLYNGRANLKAMNRVAFLVTSKRTYHVGPYSAQIIEAHVPPCQTNGTILISPLTNCSLFADEPGVPMPNTIVPGKVNKAYVAIINETSRLVRVAHDMILAMAQPVSLKEIEEISHGVNQFGHADDTDCDSALCILVCLSPLRHVPCSPQLHA